VEGYIQQLEALHRLQFFIPMVEEDISILVVNHQSVGLLHQDERSETSLQEKLAAVDSKKEDKVLHVLHFLVLFELM
jgi:hypothetical protein